MYTCSTKVRARVIIPWISASRTALIVASLSRLIALAMPPTRKLGCGFFPPKIVCRRMTSRCQSSASR